MVHTLWKTVWWFLTKLNTLLPYNIVITLLGTYPKERKICLPKNLPKLGVNQNALQWNEWINKLWYIQTMDYYSAIKRNELSSHKKTRKLRCILLSERSLSEKLHCCMITTIWHSGKSKTIETEKRWVIARGSGRRSKGEISGREEIWGQWSYSVWSHNYRHTMLQVCQNS